MPEGSLFPPSPQQKRGSALPALEVTGIAVRYRDGPVLFDLSVTVPPGQLVGVIGPNGAGKTTLFRAILGLLPLEKGHIRVLGEQVHRVRHRIAYVPQREQVNWNFPVRVCDVVMMGRYRRIGWLRRPGPEDREAVEACLRQVEMHPHAEESIGRLSGGQQQRVFLARALAQAGDLLLLDEPFAGVDAATQEAVLTLLERLRERGQTVLVATHDLSCLGDRFNSLLCLNRRLIAFGPTSQVFTAQILAETYSGRPLSLRTLTPR